MYEIVVFLATAASASVGYVFGHRAGRYSEMAKAFHDGYTEGWAYAYKMLGSDDE